MSENTHIDIDFNRRIDRIVQRLAYGQPVDQFDPFEVEAAKILHKNYHPAYRALDSVGTEIATFDHESEAVDYWTGAPTGADTMQYWNGTEWESFNPSSFTK